MKYSVLLTLHDRDEIDLQKVFKQLAKAAAGRQDDIEFVIGLEFAEGEFPNVEAIARMFAESVPHDCHVIRFDTTSIILRDIATHVEEKTAHRFEDIRLVDDRHSLAVVT